jgi:hypothetical protein
MRWIVLGLTISLSLLALFTLLNSPLHARHAQWRQALAAAAPAAASGNGVRYLALPEEISPAAKLAHTLVNDRYRFIACLLPKAGCSLWLRYLRSATLPPAVATELNAKLYRHTPSAAHGFRWREQLEPTEWEALANDDGHAAYTRFAVVRHPWDRLVSAYRSKYEGACNGSRSCLRSRFKVPLARPPLGRGRAAGPGDVSFHDFVLALAKQPPSEMNAHFRPMHLGCELHRYPYSLIMDVGDEAAARKLARDLGLNESAGEFGARIGALRAYGTERYYGGRTHRTHRCSARTVAAAQHMYALDALLLGYSFGAAYRACEATGSTHS